MKANFQIILLSVVFLFGCSYALQRSANRENLTKLQLGMSPSQVMAIMGTEIVDGISGRATNPYQREILLGSDKTSFEVFYYYTEHVGNKKWESGMTPVIFKDEKLAGIGWNAFASYGLKTPYQSAFLAEYKSPSNSRPITNKDQEKKSLPASFPTPKEASKNDTQLTSSSVSPNSATQKPRNTAQTKTKAKDQSDDLKTVFGIKIGERLSIPECEKNLDRPLKPKEEDFNSGTYEFCYAQFGHLFDNESNTPPLITGEIHVEPTTMLGGPKLARLGGFNGLIIDGVLEEIEFYTWGIEAQDIVFDALKEKYGKPFKYEPKNVQNKMGARYEAFDATWQFDDLNVIFFSVENKLDSGRVIISTDRALIYRAKEYDVKQKQYKL